jgi:hypothetical protein
MAASNNNTTVTPSFITDSLGGTWSIAAPGASGAQVCHNGVIDTTTSHVALLLYNGTTVYYENTSNGFFCFLNPGWAATGDPRVVSPSGTTITTAGPAIIDAALNKWTLVLSATAGTGLQIAVNGVIDPVTNNVICLLYQNSLIYQENSGLGWWSKALGATSWTGTTSPLLSESANGTTVTTVGPAIIDASLEKFTLVASSNGNQIAVNGVVDPVTNNVILLLYYNHMVYQENSGLGWWSKSISTAPWVLTTDPRSSLSPPSPALAATTYGAAQTYSKLVYNMDGSNPNQIFFGTNSNNGVYSPTNLNWLLATIGLGQTNTTANQHDFNNQLQVVLNSTGCYITADGYVYINPTPPAGATNNAYTASLYTGMNNPAFAGVQLSPGSNLVASSATSNGNGWSFYHGYIECCLSFVLPRPVGSGQYPSICGYNSQVFPACEFDFLETPTSTWQPSSGVNCTYQSSVPPYLAYGSTNPSIGTAFVSQTLHQWSGPNGSQFANQGSGGVNTTVFLPSNYLLGGPGSPVGSGTSSTYPNAQFNTFGVLWTPTTVAFYINNVLTQFYYSGGSANASSGNGTAGQNPISTVNAALNAVGMAFTAGNNGQGMVMNIGTGTGWPMLLKYLRVWQY